MNNNSPKDGFDLIDYPCDYGFKAMCKNVDGVDASTHIKELVLVTVDEGAFLKIKSASSRTGKFESVTVTIRLQSREELEAVYHSIANSPYVVMTL